MLTETTLCMGCMNNKTYDGPCKLCGYSEDDPYIPTYLAPKTLLNKRYIVGRLLSYNGEGATYIGYDNAAGVKVTIKEFMPDTLCSRGKGETDITVNSENSALYKTLMSEFEDLNRTLMKLQGTTHIQAVLDVFFENNTCYAIFEFVVGISLKTFLANSSGGLTWDQVKELFPPICTTLSLVHQAGIIHRGLSPQTLFVTDKMELKLTGFCISAARTANTEVACEIYNGYAAPEQYTSDEVNGTWTDVYGIAAVLYRVLTGTTPADSSAGATNLHEPMLLNRNVPANVSGVIMHGMERSPEQRISSIGDFVSRLFAPPKYAPSSGASKREQGNISTNVQRRLEKQKKERRKTLTVISIAGFTLIFFAVTLVMSLNGAFAPNHNSTSQPNSAANSSTASTVTISAGIPSSIPDTESSEVNIVEDPASSVTENLVKVPDFTDRRYDKTVTQYEGLFVFVPTYDYSDIHPAGLMFDQSVEEGEMVAEGTQISVKVSKGSSAVALPAFNGMTGDDYVAKLTSLNIKYSIEEVSSVSIRKGYVVKCNREVGDLVNVGNGETVTVYVSRGGT